jgi:hypothetical protein
MNVPDCTAHCVARLRQGGGTWCGPPETGETAVPLLSAAFKAAS